MANKTKTASNTAKNSRVRKLNRRNKKQVVKATTALPASWRLFLAAIKHLWLHKRLFGIILLTYSVLYFVFVKGLAANFELDQTKKLLDDTIGQELGRIGTVSALFGFLIGTAGTTAGEAASVYQMALFVLISLVIIRALRGTVEATKSTLTVRELFYESSYPLIQYILVGFVIVLQLLPAMIAMTVYSIVSANGIAIGLVEQIFWLLIMVFGMGVSVYLISSSLFASYIVTLPNMTPMRALRSARKLVRYRRWSIIRKVLFLPAALLLIMLVIFLPLLLWVPVVAEILFLIVALALVLVLHSYFYLLYRELL